MTPKIDPRMIACGAINRHDDLKQATLTRDDVAKRLGVSVSTVRRIEGSKPHPRVTDGGVRRFKPTDVEQLAATFAANQNTPRNDVSGGSS